MTHVRYDFCVKCYEDLHEWLNHKGATPSFVRETGYGDSVEDAELERARQKKDRRTEPTERPRCDRCGQVVSVHENPGALRLSWSRPSPSRFTAWCGCAKVAATDKHFRDVAYGETEEAAIAAWRNPEKQEPHRLAAAPGESLPAPDPEYERRVREIEVKCWQMVYDAVRETVAEANRAGHAVMGVETGRPADGCVLMQQIMIVPDTVYATVAARVDGDEIKIERQVLL